MRLAVFNRIVSRTLGAGQSVATLGATAAALPGAIPGASPAISEGEFLYERQQEFGGIYRRLYERLVEHAGRFVGRHEAEDAVADAMFALWRRWPTLSLDQRTGPYIFAVVKLKALTTMKNMQLERMRQCKGAHQGQAGCGSLTVRPINGCSQHATTTV